MLIQSVGIYCEAIETFVKKTREIYVTRLNDCEI